jgi:tryptophan synthase alpha chain
VSRVTETFAAARAKQRPALVPYVMCGDPDLATTPAIVRALAAGGADLVELGVPFSDPLADGPVIQLAGQRALAAGTTVAGVLDVVRELRVGSEPLTLPIVLMGYINPLLAYGLGRFAADASAAGVDALIVPDLPLHEAVDLQTALHAAGIALVPLVAPTSTDAHIAAAAATARAGGGFVYCVAFAGVTGARTATSDDAPALVARVRAADPDVPTVVGFGISTAEHVAAVGAFADGVVVGSALVAALAGAEEPTRVATTFVASLSG